MQDKAQEISAVIWRWFRECVSKDNKSEHDWKVMLKAGEQLVKKYEDDKLNCTLAEDLFFAFAEHAGRLQKVKEGKL